MSYQVIVVALCIFACTVTCKPMGDHSDNSNSTLGNTQKNQDWAICNVDGKELKPGQKAPKGSFVFECQKSDNMVRTTIVGCLDDEKKEHPIGEKYVQGDKPFSYEFECAKTGHVTEIRVSACVYKSDEGQVKLEPGNSQTVGNKVVRCERRSDGGVQFQISYPASLNVAATNNGTSTNTNTNNGNNNDNKEQKEQKEQPKDLKKCK